MPDEIGRDLDGALHASRRLEDGIDVQQHLSERVSKTIIER